MDLDAWPGHAEQRINDKAWPLVQNVFRRSTSSSGTSCPTAAHAKWCRQGKNGVDEASVQNTCLEEQGGASGEGLEGEVADLSLYLLSLSSALAL